MESHAQLVTPGHCNYEWRVAVAAPQLWYRLFEMSGERRRASDHGGASWDRPSGRKVGNLIKTKSSCRQAPFLAISNHEEAGV